MGNKILQKKKLFDSTSKYARRGKMIDSHAHLGKVKYGYEPLTTEEIIQFMDRWKIEKSVILPLINPEEEDYYYTTEQAIADSKKYPGRFIPFVNIDPRRSSNDGNYDFYPLIKEYLDQGCKGFGEILANLPTNDKRMKGIYKACGKLNIPVLPDFRAPTKSVGVIEPLGLPYLEEVLKEFPETVIIGHGPAFWAEISGDVTPEEKECYPEGKIARPGRVDYLLEKYPNLYADLSAMSGYNAMVRDHQYAKAFLQKHFKKILFGTDYFVNRQPPLIIDFVNNIGLSSEEKERIFHKNTAELLKLKD
jgi:uncharacterized protein